MFLFARLYPECWLEICLTNVLYDTALNHTWKIYIISISVQSVMKGNNVLNVQALHTYIQKTLYHDRTKQYTHIHTLVDDQYLAGWPPRKIILSSESMCKSIEIWSINKYIIIIIINNLCSNSEEKKLANNHLHVIITSTYKNTTSTH